MHRRANGVDGPSTGLTALRVWRVEQGVSAIVRILSPVPGKRVRGCFTHWGRSKSVLCLDGDCPAPLHKQGGVWKGYLAAEVYNQTERHWCPVALEITEHLELDLRGLIDRGTVWELSRPLSERKKHFPVAGVLLEERDPLTFPTAFDLAGCLLHLYHPAPAVNLIHLNPLPPRTLVKPSLDAPPAAYKTRLPLAGAAPSEEDAQKAAEQVRELMAQRRARGGWMIPGEGANLNGNGKPAPGRG